VTFGGMVEVTRPDGTVDLTFRRAECPYCFGTGWSWQLEFTLRDYHDPITGKWFVGTKSYKTWLENVKRGMVPCECVS